MKNSVAMRESNHNSDRKNVIIILISFADEVKSFFKGMHKGILDHFIVTKKDKLFCPVFLFHRGMSNDICDLMLYRQREGLNIS